MCKKILFVITFFLILITAVFYLLSVKDSNIEDKYNNEFASLLSKSGIVTDKIKCSSDIKSECRISKIVMGNDSVIKNLIINFKENKDKVYTLDYDIQISNKSIESNLNNSHVSCRFGNNFNVENNRMEKFFKCEIKDINKKIYPYNVSFYENIEELFKDTGFIRYKISSGIIEIIYLTNMIAGYIMELSIKK